MDGVPYNGTIYKINSFIWVKQGDDNALMEVLEKYGPVSVAIDASHPLFVNYVMGYYASLKGTCNSSLIGLI